MESTLLGLRVFPRLDPRGGGIADYYVVGTCQESCGGKDYHGIATPDSQNHQRIPSTYQLTSIPADEMFTPSVPDSIKVQDINGDSDGTMKRNHGVPSDANVYVEEPLSVSSRKRIRQMDSDVKRSAAAKHKASTQERKLDIINRKRGAAANDKASPQANVVRVTRSAAAKHKASTQVSKLDIKKDVIKRKRGAAANDKSSPQAKMFLGTLPLISNSIRKVQEDSDGMKGPNHDTPSNTNVQVEEPLNSSVRSSKRIRQMDSLSEIMRGQEFTFTMPPKQYEDPPEASEEEPLGGADGRRSPRGTEEEPTEEPQEDLREEEADSDFVSDARSRPEPSNSAESDSTCESRTYEVG
ncbi:hypothetical protein Tco_0356239 [Tanacetum coccineum]